MAHHSRLSSLVLDCKVEDLKDSIEFWSKALGKPVKDYDSNGDGKYGELEADADELMLLLQKVDHPSRVHLDIESDDVDAEAERLEKLGARKIEKIHTWWVLEAPSGHRFCVVRKQRGPFGPHVNTWED